MLADGTIVVAVRCKSSFAGAVVEIYASDDGGATWRFMNRLNDHGDTCDLALLDDGRIVAVYGYRRPPYGIRAKVSEDGGNSWGPELILRGDGGSSDLGYPRCVQLGDSRVFASYYFNDHDDPVKQNGGVGYIAGTLLSL